MVAASATAILNDIAFSNFASPPVPGSHISTQNPQNSGFTHAFLTACVNQTLSARGLGLVPQQQQRKCWKQSK
jgi:hypothetical protein